VGAVPEDESASRVGSRYQSSPTNACGSRTLFDVEIVDVEIDLDEPSGQGAPLKNKGGEAR
jgi:hypothetical protein